jgi:hypothetical protein
MSAIESSLAAPLIGPGGWTLRPPVTLPDSPVKSVDPDTPEAMKTAAVKFDGGKVRYDLLPWDAIEQLAILYTVGAQKYEENNWLRGFRYGRTMAAMLRHLNAWWLSKLMGKDGKDYENADLYAKLGLEPQSHLVAVVWNAVALLTFELRGLGVDDRPGSRG